MNLSSLVMAGAEPLPMLKGTSLVLLHAILAQSAKVMLALFYLLVNGEEERGKQLNHRDEATGRTVEAEGPSTTSVLRVDHALGASQVGSQLQGKKDVSTFFSSFDNTTPKNNRSAVPTTATTSMSVLLSSREEAVAVLQTSHRIVLLTALHLLACPLCSLPQSYADRQAGAAPSETYAQWLAEVERQSAKHVHFKSRAFAYFNQFIQVKFSAHVGEETTSSCSSIEEQLSAAVDVSPSLLALGSPKSTSSGFQRFARELLGAPDKGKHRDSSFPPLLALCVQRHRFLPQVLLPFLYTTASEEHALVWRDTALLRRCLLQWRQRRGMSLLTRLMVVRATPTPTPSDQAVATPRQPISVGGSKLESPVQRVEEVAKVDEEVEEGSCSSSVLIDQVLASVAQKEHHAESKEELLQAEKKRAQIGEISSLQVTPLQAKYSSRVDAANSPLQDEDEKKNKASFLPSAEHSELSVLLRGTDSGGENIREANSHIQADCLRPKDSPPPVLGHTAIRYNSSTKQPPSDMPEESQLETENHNSGQSENVHSGNHNHHQQETTTATTTTMDNVGNKEVSIVHAAAATTTEDANSTCRSLRPTLEEVMEHPSSLSDKQQVDVNESRVVKEALTVHQENERQRRREEEVLRIKRIIFHHWRDTRLYRRLAVAYLHKKREEQLQEAAWQHWRNLYTGRTLAVKIVEMEMACNHLLEQKEQENYSTCFTRWRRAAQARQLLRRTVGKRAWHQMRLIVQLRWYQRQNYNARRTDLMDRLCPSPPDTSNVEAGNENNDVPVESRVVTANSQDNTEETAKWAPVLSLIPNSNPSLLVNVCWARWKVKWQQQTADRWHAAQARRRVFMQWKAKAHYRHHVIAGGEAQRDTLLLRRCFSTWRRQHKNRCTLAPQQRASTDKRTVKATLDRWRKRYEVRVLYRTCESNLQTLQKRQKLQFCFDRWRAQWDIVDRQTSFTQKREKETVTRCFQKWKQKAQLEAVLKHDMLEFASNLYYSFLEKRCFRTWYYRKYQARVQQKQAALEQQREEEAERFFTQRSSAKVFYHWRAAFFLRRHHQVDPRRRLPRALNQTTAMLLLEDVNPNAYANKRRMSPTKKTEKAPLNNPQHHPFVHKAAATQNATVTPSRAQAPPLSSKGGLLDAERMLWWNTRARRDANNNNINNNTSKKAMTVTYVSEVHRRQPFDEEKVVVLETQEEKENGDIVRQRNVFYTDPHHPSEYYDEEKSTANDSGKVWYSQITRSPYKHYEAREAQREIANAATAETHRTIRHLPSPQSRADGLNISTVPSSPPSHLLPPSPLPPRAAPPVGVVTVSPRRCPPAPSASSSATPRSVKETKKDIKGEDLVKIYATTTSATPPRTSPSKLRTTSAPKAPPPATTSMPSRPSAAASVSGRSTTTTTTTTSTSAKERKRAPVDMKPTISSLNKAVPVRQAPVSKKPSAKKTATSLSSSIQVLAVTPPQRKPSISKVSPQSDISLALTPIVKPAGGKGRSEDESASLSAADLYYVQP